MFDPNRSYKAVFFDRDGPINALVDRGPGRRLGGKLVRRTAPWNVAELRIHPGVQQVVREVQQRGYLAIVATNQPDVTYGALSEEEYQAIHSVIAELGFDDIWACRHHRDDGCECRKPKPGLLFRAAEKWGIDLSASFFVGDMETDMIAAASAGCQGVLLRMHYNLEVVHRVVIHSLPELFRLLPKPV